MDIIVAPMINIGTILLKISCGPAKKIAREAMQELITNADDDCDIIHYNHLLRLMDEYEYKNGN